MKLFEKRKTKGAISIFLIMILIPTMLFSAVLIDGSRLSSAKAMVQEAADLAAMSVLTDYNQELKDDFGLFALKDKEKIEEIYKESLNATLLASGMAEDQEYSEQLWEILKTSAGAGNPYKGKEFLNLYDFSADSCKVTPKYSLAEWQVLENQMVEYSKFRGIYVIADRLGIFSSLGQVQKQAEDNQQASGSMEEKMEIDEDNGAVEKAFIKLRESTAALNQSVARVSQLKDDYFRALEARMAQVRHENIEEDETEFDERLAASYGKSQQELKNELKGLSKKASDVLNQTEKTIKEVEKAIGRLESYQAENRSSSNEVTQGLVQDAAETVEQYEKSYLPDLNDLKNDAVLNRLKSDTSLDTRMDQTLDMIDEAITRYAEELAEQRAEADAEEPGEEETEAEEQEEIAEIYYFYYLGEENKTEEIGEAVNGSSSTRCYKPAVNSVIEYFGGKSWKELNPTLEVNQEKGSSVINEDNAKSLSGSQGNKDADSSSAKRGEIDQSVYNMRPSHTFQSEEGSKTDTNFFNKDGDLSASKNIIGQGKNGSMIQQLGETARDDILCLSYMFGTFKTRLTGVEKFSAKGMPEEEKNKFYMPKWRYAHEDGELDLRFSPKKARETVLRGEIEYLIYGNRTDRANEDAVYATIYAERLANNMIVLYLDKKGVNKSCHIAAAAASAATGGVVPEPVFFWIFLTAWSVAETTLDMTYLVEYGYKIPLLKTKNNILLKDFPDQGGLVSNYGEDGVFVTYEDYLLILLLLKKREERLMRSADLIEMNMKKKQSDFAMSGAYTYLEADTEMSVRYLFGSAAPFQAEYQKGGVTGRMKFNSHIYMGY